MNPNTTIQFIIYINNTTFSIFNKIFDLNQNNPILIQPWFLYFYYITCMIICYEFYIDYI